MIRLKMKGGSVGQGQPDQEARGQVVAARVVPHGGVYPWIRAATAMTP